MPDSTIDNDTDLKQFLFEDYKLRVEYINAHFSRMWTRFSFFLLVEGGIFGVLFSYFWDKANNTRHPNALLVAIAGALVCVFVGIEDRYLVGAYRSQIKDAAERLKKTHSPQLANYKPIGHLKDGFDSKHPLEWRWNVFSVTRLVVYFPFVVAISWVVVITHIWN